MIHKSVDVFDWKGITIRLTKDDIIGLKKKLIEHDVSMQQLFSEFITLVLDDDEVCVRVIDSAISRQKKRLIERELGKNRKKKPQTIDEKVGARFEKVAKKPKHVHDADSLYDLIDGGD